MLRFAQDFSNFSTKNLAAQEPLSSGQTRTVGNPTNHSVLECLYFPDAYMESEAIKTNQNPSEFFLLFQLHSCSYSANTLHIFFRTRNKTLNSQIQEWLEGKYSIVFNFPSPMSTLASDTVSGIQWSLGDKRGWRTLKYCFPYARKKSFPSVNRLRASSPHSQLPTNGPCQSYVSDILCSIGNLALLL